MIQFFKYFACCFFLHHAVYATTADHFYLNPLCDLEQVTLNSPNLLTRCCSEKGNRGRQRCQIGKASFLSTNSDTWYTVETDIFPNFVPFSQNRVEGSVQGKVKLLDSGLKIKKAGNYFVSFTAGITTQEPSYTSFIVVAVALDGVVNPQQVNVNGADVIMVPPLAGALGKGSAILENVPAGTVISLVASNTGSPEPQPIQVVTWTIDIFEIPCQPDRHN